MDNKNEKLIILYRDCKRDGTLYRAPSDPQLNPGKLCRKACAMSAGPPHAAADRKHNQRPCKSKPSE